MNLSHLMLAVALMLATTTVAVGLARKLNMGSIVALLLVGVTLGPHSPIPLFTEHIDEMQAVGEVGVMLLLFAVGLDSQPGKLRSMGRLVFGLGLAQYAVTTAAILAFLMAVSRVAHIPWQSALVLSLGLAMSSTAIPIPILRERGEENTAHGRAVVAIDVFQSVMVVPVLALIPALAAGPLANAYGVDLGKVLSMAAAIGGIYALGRYLLPWALSIAARSFGPGGFAVIVLAGVFFGGWWMETAGISMALGAFMIGALLSTSSYVEQIKAAVTPFRQFLLALFFIAIGMAIDPGQLVELKDKLLFYVPALLLIKCIVLFILVRFFRFELRSAILTALLMMPFDEICYVILANAKANGLLSARHYTVGLSVLSFSFLASPVLINLGYRLTGRLAERGTAPVGEAGLPPMSRRVVVAGCGYVGRAICSMLEQARIPYTAFELDLERLARAKEAGYNALYGDIADPIVMSTVAIARARLVIVTMSLHESARRMIGNLQRFYPHVPVMTAVTYLAQRDELRQMGAADVVALAPEGTLNFGCRVLHRLGMGVKHAEAIAEALRSGDYAALRGVAGSEQEITATPAIQPGPAQVSRA